MNGYFQGGKVGENGILKISVINMPELRKLLDKAEKEADQLRSTIRQLEDFDLTIELEINGQGRQISRLLLSKTYR